MHGLQQADYLSICALASGHDILKRTAKPTRNHDDNGGQGKGLHGCIEPLLIVTIPVLLQEGFAVSWCD